MKVLGSSIVLTAIVLVAVVSVRALKDEAPEVASKGLLGGKFKLPKLFDFERFKEAFHKHYKSDLAESVRRKFFLARAFRAFTSWVAFKYGKVRSYLGINPMSDWSPEEVNSIYVARAPEDIAPAHQVERRKIEEMPLASLDEIESALEQVASHKDQPGFAELSKELENAPKRNRRTVGAHSHVDVDDLFKDPASVKHNVSRKYTSRIPSNNPNYEPIEMDSMGLEPMPQDNGDEHLIQFGSIGAGIGFVANTLTSYLPSLWNSQAEEPVKSSMASVLEDEMFLDHRDSGCLLEPRDQGKCGSCYSFSAISAYEHAYCNEFDELVAFSEQYMVDCGGAVTDTLAGCNGGWLGDTGSFVDGLGLELRSHFPYKAANDSCPIIDKRSAGYLRTRNGDLYSVRPNRIDAALKKGPILTSITTPPGFSEYADGVADCREKDKPVRHAMLIVGHGREDGQEYWLIRNSHGVYWGSESGHYKLNKKTDCIKELYIIKAVYDGTPLIQENKNYNNEGLKRRRRIEMLGDVLELHKKSRGM